MLVIIKPAEDPDTNGVVLARLSTRVVVDELVEAGRWDENNRIVVKAQDGEHSWTFRESDCTLIPVVPNEDAPE